MSTNTKQRAPSQRFWFQDYKLRAAFLFLLPAMAILIVFSLLPSLAAIGLSFTKWDMMSPARFAGLDNYKRLLVDARFKTSFVNTLYYVLGSVPLGVLFSLIIALVLNEKWLKGKVLFRTLFFIPVVVSSVAVSMMWSWIYSPAYGFLNAVLSVVGIPKQFWTSDPHLAIPSLIVMTIWQTFGFNVVIFLAGLLSIPIQLYEAAMVDGANKWQQIRHITLPLLAPTTTFVIIMAIIRSFQVFDQVLILGGVAGPPKSLMVTVYYLYQVAFGSLKMGYGTTIGVVLFLTILIVVITQFKYYTRRFEV
jgi:multiple sugar transport system permease protein